MNLSAETKAAWEAHVLAEYPKEACAFVVDGALFPVANLSDTPETSFKVDSVERIRAHATGRVEAFLHSHPYRLEDSPFEWDPAWASEHDMRTWIADNLPWGISATDGEGVSAPIWYDDAIEAAEPLEGRAFISGKTDCFSVVRDYFRIELGVNIPNFARGMGWWNRGQDLYRDNFEKAGFVEIPLDQVQVNDVLLMRIGTDVITHAAVVIAPNKILHHLVRRLSGTDTMSKWYRQVVCAVRYAGEESDAN